MLHHDAAHHPSDSQQGAGPAGKKAPPSGKSAASQAAHLAFLKSHPFQTLAEDDIEMVCVDSSIQAFMLTPSPSY